MANARSLIIEAVPCKTLQLRTPDNPAVTGENSIHAQTRESIKHRAPKAFTMINVCKIRPAMNYQSLQTGFWSGHWNASLNSRELAMVSCTQH